jgi:hypothetical protein
MKYLKPKPNLVKMFEDFTENPEAKIDMLLTDLKRQIQYWFEFGSFKNEKWKFIDMEPNKSLGLHHSFVFNFEETNGDNAKYMWTVFIMVNLEDALTEKIEKFYLQIKKLDWKQSKLLNQWAGTITVSDFKETKFTELMETVNKATIKIPDTEKEANDFANNSDRLTDDVY